MRVIACNVWIVGVSGPSIIALPCNTHRARGGALQGNAGVTAVLYQHLIVPISQFRVCGLGCRRLKCASCSVQTTEWYQDLVVSRPHHPLYCPPCWRRTNQCWCCCSGRLGRRAADRSCLFYPRWLGTSPAYRPCQSQYHHDHINLALSLHPLHILGASTCAASETCAQPRIELRAHVCEMHVF